MSVTSRAIDAGLERAGLPLAEPTRLGLVAYLELLEKWNQGWDVLLGSLDTLADDQLAETVYIRHEPLRVHEALLRSVTHTGYHVGQIVYLAKVFTGTAWSSLSIPVGQSEAWKQDVPGK